VLVACASPRGTQDDAGEASEASRAEALLDSKAPPAPGPVLRSRAEAIEALAVREGAGVRAVELHALAGRLFERAWRIDAVDADALLAVRHYRAASTNVALPGACKAAIHAATLEGERTKSAETTYAELYRVARRSDGDGEPLDGGTTGGPCRAELAPILVQLASFRPNAAVLQAIDRSLESEGAMARAVRDAGAWHAAPRITSVERWIGRDAARVVVHVDRSARFRVGDVGAASGPGGKTFVEFDGVELASEVGSRANLEARADAIVSRVVAESTTTGSRVALDMSGAVYRRVFQLLEPFRIVIDIAKTPPGLMPAGTVRTVSRVAIDAGHGGNDPGAQGPNGTREKDVTLSVAKKLATLLPRQGLEVELTRASDRYVTLEERTARANAFGADLFVSIHCNAAENRTRRGVETYVLDTTTSDMAGRVAARENATSQSASNEVSQLLASMRIADQATRSTHFAELLQRSSMASLRPRFGDVLDGGVHRAAFYVLVGARMPAVLFETSYISNAAEEQRLGSADYQERLADAIANAIKAYREGR
jgi:N-acetylmuramoyl-L-alanine amidase